MLGAMSFSQVWWLRFMNWNLPARRIHFSNRVFRLRDKCASRATS
jgi:hypothetical protein